MNKKKVTLLNINFLSFLKIIFSIIYPLLSVIYIILIIYFFIIIIPTNIMDHLPGLLGMLLAFLFGIPLLSLVYSFIFALFSYIPFKYFLKIFEINIYIETKEK